MASDEVRKVDAALTDLIERVVRRLQLRFFQAVTFANPVDTGFSRAGWSPSRGAGSGGSTDRPVSDQVARRQAAALFAKNSAEARAIAATYRLREGAVFIVNNVKYVVFLNQGTSAQAPRMFVERALATAVRRTRREIAA